MIENPHINLSTVVADAKTEHLESQRERIKARVKMLLISIDHYEQANQQRLNEIERNKKVIEEYRSEIAKLENGDWGVFNDPKSPLQEVFHPGHIILSSGTGPVGYAQG